MQEPLSLYTRHTLYKTSSWVLALRRTPQNFRRISAARLSKPDSHSRQWAGSHNRLDLSTAPSHMSICDVLAESSNKQRCLSFPTVASELGKRLPLCAATLLRLPLQEHALTSHRLTRSTPGSLHLRVRGRIAPFPATHDISAASSLSRVSLPGDISLKCKHSRAITSFHGFLSPLQGTSFSSTLRRTYDTHQLG